MNWGFVHLYLIAEEWLVAFCGSGGICVPWDAYSGRRRGFTRFCDPWARYSAMNDMGKLQGVLIGRFRMVACFRFEEEPKSPSRRGFRGDASKEIQESQPRSLPRGGVQSGVAQDARRSEQPMGDRCARASFPFEAVRYNKGRLRFRHKRGCCGSFRFNCFNYSKCFEQFEYFKYDR